MKLARMKITNDSDEVMVVKFKQPVTDTESHDIEAILVPGESTSAWCSPIDSVTIVTSW